MIWHESVGLIDLPLLASELVTPDARFEFGRRFTEIQAKVDANPKLGEPLNRELSDFRQVRFASSATHEDAPDLRLVYRISSPECFLLCVGKRNFSAGEPYRTARVRLRSSSCK